MSLIKFVVWKQKLASNLAKLCYTLTSLPNSVNSVVYQIPKWNQNQNLWIRNWNRSKLPISKDSETSNFQRFQIQSFDLLKLNSMHTPKHFCPNSSSDAFNCSDFCTRIWKIWADLLFLGKPQVYNWGFSSIYFFLLQPQHQKSPKDPFLVARLGVRLNLCGGAAIEILIGTVV